MNPTAYDNCLPVQQEKITSSFLKLANSQRGLPESLAVSSKANPGLFNATGIFTHLAEHVGDLTHRISEWGGDFTDFGYGSVAEKVDRALRYLNNPDIESMIKVNIYNNWGYYLEVGKIDGQDISIFQADFQAAANKYSQAHQQLIVYNLAQYHCNQATIALGKLDFKAAKASLEVIREQLSLGVKSWRQWAGESLFVGEDGPIAFDGKEYALESSGGLKP